MTVRRHIYIYVPTYSQHAVIRGMFTNFHQESLKTKRLLWVATEEQGKLDSPLDSEYIIYKL